MKRLIVFVPVTLLVLFTLNSFVRKESQAAKVSVGKVNKNEPEIASTVLRSADGGQTWVNVSKTKPEIKKRLTVAESGGVIIATGQKGIQRSTDNGKHWKWVISEGGVGITVERIEGGFAAIAYNTKTQSRMIHISMDNGKTWQAIDKGLPPSPGISSIKQMGKYLIVGHPGGIYRSADMGKTWKRVRCAVEPKAVKNDYTYHRLVLWNEPAVQPVQPAYVYRVYALDNTLYAVAEAAGC